jgi:DNA polymerase I-like protein with 3'-5' exonuclease and polymerase domains
MQNKLQIPMFTNNPEWVPPDELPDLSSAKEIAIDLETRDPNLKNKGPGWPTKDGEVIGYAVATSFWSGYLPVKHLGGGNLDEGLIKRWLQKQLNTGADKIMHNAQYDLGWLRAEGFDVRGRVIDTMVTANLLDENRFSYSLNALGYDYLGKVKSEKGLIQAARDFGVDPKSEMWKLPAMYVGEYAEMDATLTLELWTHFKTLIQQEGVQDIWDLETALIPHLVEMTRRGIRVDIDRAERSKQEVMKRERGLLKEIKDMTGAPVDIWAAASISKAFDKLDIPYPRTEKGAPSFTKSFLTDHKHPLAQAIAGARSYNKINGTFIDGILKYVGADGRVHGHINQIRSDDGGTVSGRISMSNPNLQQIPSRDPILGPMIRSLFLPDEGKQWASIDFSQQEPRLAVHYADAYGRSVNQALTGVAELVHAFNVDPATDFHTMVAEMTGLPRKEAKTCIAEGELVLTNHGLVPIEKITVDHLVWDGVEWVQHDGLVYQGIKEVITYDGLTATTDHEVWVGQDRTLPFGVAASGLERLVRTGMGECPVRVLDGCVEKHPTSWEAYLRSSALRMWDRGLEGFRQFEARFVHALPVLSLEGTASKSGEHAYPISGGGAFATSRGIHFSALPQQKRSKLPQLRGAGDKMPVFLKKSVVQPPAFDALGGGLEGLRDRSDRQQRTLRAEEPAPRHPSAEQAKQASHTMGVLRWAAGCAGTLMALGQNRFSRLRLWSEQGSDIARTGLGRQRHSVLPSRRIAKVYDIANAGPRNRFTVSGRLVHNCGLGILYGMGAAKLADQLDVSVDQAKAILKQFNDTLPFLKQLNSGVQRRLEDPRSSGSIRSILGRKCRFNMWEPAAFGMNKSMPYEEAVAAYGPTTRLQRAMTYKALNRLIQASAADMTKKAWLDCCEAGHLPMLQVHDEMAFSVETQDEARKLSGIMSNAVPLCVPNRCDIDMGPSWGEATDIA